MSEEGDQQWAERCDIRKPAAGVDVLIGRVVWALMMSSEVERLRPGCGRCNSRLAGDEDGLGRGIQTLLQRCLTKGLHLDCRLAQFREEFELAKHSGLTVALQSTTRSYRNQLCV